MSGSAASDGRRERSTVVERTIPPIYDQLGGSWRINTPGRQVSSRTGRQVTVSESHHHEPDGSWDGGGPFYTSRTYVDSFCGTNATLGPKTRSGTPAKYSGPITFALPSTENAAVASFMKGLGSEDTSHLDPDGATAIAHCAPTRSAATLAQGLAEQFREGFPTLAGIKSWERRANLLKAAGDEYLNAVFGWFPLIHEVKDTASAAAWSSRIAKQYKRDEGKNVRRSYSFDTVTTSTGPVKVGQGAASIPGPASFNDFEEPREGGDILLETSVSKRKKFVGCFTYALPSETHSFRGVMDAGSQADHLLGTALTPSVLWELAPWSWAVDWFSNTGEVINNVTMFGQYGLVMRYGYMMEHSIEKRTYTLTDAALYGAAGKTVGPLSFVRETKVRTPANPFGFGVGWEGLSPTQLAITAALGITRL